jgi:hypothetical protein
MLTLIKIVMYLCCLIMIVESLGVQSRVKREGFGPWEANEVWDEKGKSNIFPVLKTIVDIIANETIILEKALNASIAVAGELVEVFEHPFRELSKTYVGWAILLFAGICAISIFIRVSVPLTRFLWSVLILFFDYLCVPFYRLCVRSTCCMYLCASKPLVIMRNVVHRKRMEKESRRRMEFYKPSEEIQMLKKTTSAIYTDDVGVYLLADENHRVYLHPERQTEDLLMLKSLSSASRDKGATVETIKESVLSISKLYKVEKIPDFQGTFEVDGNLIGHFSRIKFNGIDCLLTAYHVLDYNRTALINLRKGDKCVKLSSVTANVVAASRAEHLDYLILSVPSCVFSMLGMKVGVWTSRVQPREPIQINQFYEGKPCVSSAAIKVSAAKPWHVNYAASTTVGTSGAPILDSKNRIIGVHLEHDSTVKLNVGVIPPIFRMTKKESPTNEDIAQGQPELIEYSEYEAPETDDDEDVEDFSEIEAYESYLTKERDSLGIYESGISWGVFLEDVENNIADDMYQKYGDRYNAYKTTAGKTGTHVGVRVKGGRYRKESPWTCSQCACVQSKGYQCINCGYALVPLDKKRIEKVEKGASVAKAHLENNLPREMVTKIMDQVAEDTLIKKIALQVAEMLKAGGVYYAHSGQQGMEIRGDLRSGLYPDLPTNREVPMEKKLVQKLRTEPPYAPLRVDSNNSLNVATLAVQHGQAYIDGLTKVKTHVAKVNPIKETALAPGLDVAKANLVASSDEAKVNPVKGAASAPGLDATKVIPKETALAPSLNGKPALSKSAKRRLRIQKKKASNVTEPEVPLNSKAPAMSGAPTTSGMSKPSHSQNNLRRLERAISSLQEQVREKKQRSGKLPAAKNLATQSTPGPQGVQKPKSEALGSSATGTL